MALRLRRSPLPRRLFLSAIAVLGATTLGFATTVTITQKKPIESVSATGDITGVSEGQVGTQYTLVSCANDQVIVSDAQGSRFQIPLAATDYTPPAVAPPAPAPTTAATTTNAPSATASTTTNAAQVTAASTPPTTPPAASSASTDTDAPHRVIPPPPSASNSSSPGSLTADAVNAAFGRPFFSSTSFWQETAILVAQRTNLALEGRTQWEASYRRYLSGQPNDAKAQILGTGAYCVALYADADDHPTSALIAFANDGDYHGVGADWEEIQSLERNYASDTANKSELEMQIRAKIAACNATFEPYRAQQQQALTDKLTGIFGQPQQVSFGGDKSTREDALRWDWNGVSLILSCQPTTYNLLRIIPTELADNGGKAPRISRDDIGHKLSGAVEHRDNGDVIITQIPMADQGPKGYCVPATWERVLRYTGVPGDMYTLSRVGKEHFGGGGNGRIFAEELDKTLYDYGRHVEILQPTHLDYLAMRHYIDDGVPVFWAVNPKGYDGAEQRYSLCDRTKDFDTWKKLLDQARSSPKTSPPDPDEGHQVLIIGYNPDTKELAWTDPWGRNTKERWMTQEEAVRCTLGQYYIITW